VRLEAELLNAQIGHARLTIGVHDTGIGIDAATIGKIFDPFTQADESTTRRFGGSGLGLAICRELATLLGGTIDVESHSGVGSSFSLSLTLPICANAAPRMLPALSVPAVRVLTRRKALSESLLRHLAALGINDVSAEMPTAGDLDRNALVILDAGSQAEFLQIYRQRDSEARPQLIVIASSAERSVNGIESLIPAGCIVSKPVQRQALYEALATATNHSVSVTSSQRMPAAQEEAIGCHVLLVEDEAVNAAVAQGYLAALKCTCVWVDNGAQAVARSAAENFDAILMDLSMPEMDGFVTTELIRRREGAERRVPIVALTAHEADGYLDACLAAGMNDLLTKPYTLQACAGMLRRWVKQRSVAIIADPSAAEDLTSIDPAAVSAVAHLKADAADQLYAELVELFAKSSKNTLTQLDEAMTRRDVERVAALCHKLRSSAANVGALVFSNHVKLLGECALAGESARMQGLYQDIHAAYPGLIAELSRVSLKEVA